MKQIYKNPVFYYILVPAVIALWPLLVGVVHLPSARKGLNEDIRLYKQAQQTIGQILKLDPERLDFAQNGKVDAEFEYYRAVDLVARKVGIPPSNYELSSKPPRTAKRQKIQTCHVELKDVDIKKFADFLSMMKLRWTSLECTKVTLTRKKDRPDAWKVDIDFKYYF